MSDSPHAPRRLIVIAVSDYGDNNETFTKGIDAQADVIVGWLTAPTLDDKRRFALERPTPLLKVKQVRDLLHEQNLFDAQAGEALVIYITGHGQTGARTGRHYLRFAHTDDERLPGTALTTSDVVGAALASSAKHVLVMVDSCFSGALRAELIQLIEDLGRARRKLRSLAVVTAGDFEERPFIGSFTSVIERALEAVKSEEAGYARPYLSFREWEELLDEVVQSGTGLLEPQWVWPDKRTETPSLCLPNPHYRDDQPAVSAAVRELSVSESLFADYWRDRASGRTSAEDVGWYFSGRAEAMQILAGFVARGSGVLVVTGAAGSGKSALLARLVTLTDRKFLADPRFKDLAKDAAAGLPVGAVNAAVLARGKSSADLVHDLLKALEAPAVPAETAPVQALLERTEQISSDGTCTIVIDGLDEAQDPRACLNDVVLPLARWSDSGGRRAVRLVVGIRSSPQRHGAPLHDEQADELLGALLAALGETRAYVPAQVLRTDGPGCVDDITAYTQALLQGWTSSPYTDYAVARRAAEVVASATTPSFLDARLAADQLRTAEQVQDLTDTAWLDKLTTGTTALLRDDLAEVARARDIPVPILLAVLRATAFAFGAGLPWNKVWPAAAGALLPAYGDDRLEEINAAIHVLLESRLIGYLARTEEDGRTVYRPVHQRVTETLRMAPWFVSSGGAESTVGHLVGQQAHARIAAHLAGLVRRSGGVATHPYLRRHLTAHADAGDCLNDDVVPAKLLPQESSHTLRSRLRLPLPAEDARRTHLTAAAMIEPYLGHHTDGASRASSIRFHASALSGHTQPKPGPYRTVAPHLLRWQATTNVVASPPGRAQVLRPIALDDGRVLLAAGSRYGVGIWDAASGQHLADLDTGIVDTIAPLRGSSGRVFLATAGRRGVHIYDPLSGLQVDTLGPAPASDVQVMDDLHDRWRLLVRYQKRLVIWRPDSGTQPLPDTVQALRASTLAAFGHKHIAYIAAEDRSLRIWTDTGEPIPLPDLPPVDRDLIRIPRNDHADLLLLLSTRRRTHYSWDPLTDAVSPLRMPLTHVSALADRDNEPAVLGLYKQQHAEVWRYADRKWDIAGNVQVDSIAALAALPSRTDEIRIATASDAGIRLWSTPAQGTHSSPRPADSRSPKSISVPAVSSIAYVAAPAADHSHPPVWAVGTGTGVELIDVRTGHKMRELGSAGRVRGVVTVHLPDRPAVLAVLTDYLISGWDIHTDTLVYDVRHDGRAGGLFCAVDLSPGHTIMCVSAHTGLNLFSAASGARKPDQVVFQPSNHATALAPIEGYLGLVAVAGIGTVLVWDLNSDTAITKLSIGANAPIKSMCTLRTAGGVLLAAATRDRIRVWDTRTWKLVATLVASSLQTIGGLPQDDGTQLLVSGDGHSVRIWDPLTGTPIHTLITTAPVHALAAEPPKRGRLAFGGPQGFAVVDYTNI